VPLTDWGWLITPQELAEWILYQDGDLLVVDKPAGVVCHPSKHGPWSSLVGAVREYLGLGRVHMPSRLDRETSGVMVFVKQRTLASRLQRAAERGRVRKVYLAVVTGCLEQSTMVDRPLGPDVRSELASKQCVVDVGQGAEARTEFAPLQSGGGFTLCRVRPFTGRQHQIRVHAAWMGHSLVGDKIYGPEEGLYLEFIRNGFTDEMKARLLLPRQALHAVAIAFPGLAEFRAPFPADLREFCRERMGVDPEAVEGGGETG
jgi:23S rRNA pseudouridine1911/1915/1917 synthase